MKDSGLMVVILTSCGVKGDMSSKIPLPDSDNKLTSHCQFDVTINVLFFCDRSNCQLQPIIGMIVLL